MIGVKVNPRGEAETEGKMTREGCTVARFSAYCVDWRRAERSLETAMHHNRTRHSLLRCPDSRVRGVRLFATVRVDCSFAYCSYV